MLVRILQHRNIRGSTIADALPDLLLTNCEELVENAVMVGSLGCSNHRVIELRI